MRCHNDRDKEENPLQHNEAAFMILDNPKTKILILDDQKLASQLYFQSGRIYIMDKSKPVHPRRICHSWTCSELERERERERERALTIGA